MTVADTELSSALDRRKANPSTARRSDPVAERRKAGLHPSLRALPDYPVR